MATAGVAGILLLAAGCGPTMGGNRTSGAPPGRQVLHIVFRPGEVLRYRYQGAFKTPGPNGTVNQTAMNADASLTASDAGGHGASGSPRPPHPARGPGRSS
ncbi:MAG TPA: hypothetical protein VE990_15010 [Acidimicrobiales bacterium]|nr:hypothetical protein [Acidimicrobiales bacterium]